MSAGQEHGRDRDSDERDGEQPRGPTPAARASSRTAGDRLGPLPRPLALALLVVWVVATLAATVTLLRGPAPWSGELEGLVPVEHRSVHDRTLVLLRVDLDALEPDALEPDGEDAESIDPRTVLAEAGFAIEEALARERVPLAPPKTEITRWLDTHALYLLPIDTHAALAERLSDDNMLAEVRGLEARLSSPLFTVSGEQPRRDPLGIHELTKREAGRLGHVAEIPGGDAPQVSASGDLIAASGDRALVGLISDRPLAELDATLAAALAELPVEFALVDARAREAEVVDALGADAPLVLATCFAALVLVLSVALRRVVPVLVLCLCLASAGALLAAAAVSLGLTSELGLAGLELGSVGLCVLLIGFAADAALRAPKIGARGLAAPLILAGALAPLMLSPYPLWQRWALWWPLAYLVTALILRAVFPALLALLRADFEWRGAGLRLTPKPALAALACLTLCGAGIWVTPQLRYRSLARPPVALAASGSEVSERELVDHFFDPTMVVHASTSPTEAEAPGPDGAELGPAAAALDASAATTAALAELVPVEARRLDSPGSFVLPRRELEARKQALAKLKLGERMETLNLLLVDQGLRAEAFGEFVRGAADIEELPSAQAALDGPLGPWIRAYLADTDAGPELRTRVELRGRDGLVSAPLSAARLAELPALRGPAIAATLDEQGFEGRLGLAVLAGLWLSALLIWLATGSLGVAVSAALIALACEAGVMFGFSLLGLAIGPHLLPALAITGASASVVGGRACMAVRLDQPIAARVVLLASACQLAAAAALLGGGQPSWRELGLAVAIGSVLACGLGLFATPGLAALFGRRRGAARPPAVAPSPELSPEQDEPPREESPADQEKPT